MWPIARGEACRRGWTLAPVGPEHADAMARWMRDPEVVRGLGVRGAPTLESTRALDRPRAGRPDVHPFAIVADGDHVGQRRPGPASTATWARARLSIYVGEAAARGAGVGTAAVGWRWSWRAGELGLHKLWLTVHAGNAPAIAVYERCGFERRGRAARTSSCSTASAWTRCGWA